MKPRITFTPPTFSTDSIGCTSVPRPRNSVPRVILPFELITSPALLMICLFLSQFLLRLIPSKTCTISLNSTCFSNSSATARTSLKYWRITRTGCPLLEALIETEATFYSHSSNCSSTMGFSIVNRRSTGLPSNKGTSKDSNW